MPEALSLKQRRASVLPLCQRACDDLAEVLILADLLEDLDGLAAAYLRQHQDVSGLLRALACGCWRAAVVLRWCRGLVQRYATTCCRLRREGVTEPEVDSHLGSGLAVISDREAGDEEDAKGHYNAIDQGGWRYNCRSMRHVRHLVDRALAGHDVPPDISSGILDLREDIRAVVRKGR